MRFRLQVLILAAVFVASVVAIESRHAWAGTIDAAALAAGPGLGSGSLSTVTTSQANNDDVQSAGGNAVTIQKSFGSVNTMDIRLQVTNSSGSTEYRVTETVINNSPVIWFDYHVELGFGGFAGTPSAFLQSGISDLLDFDTSGQLGQPEKTPAPTSDAFSTVAHSSSVLDFSGGSVAPGESITFSFSIDVPDSGDCSIRTPACEVIGGANPTGFFFTLREFPTITGPVDGELPAPPTLLVLGSALFGVGAVTWSRRRS
jgi:hypothetical protein